MGVHAGPKRPFNTGITKDGLVFWVDALDKGSYSGTGTAVTDLIGGSVGTMTNVGYNAAGYFTFETNANLIDFAANSTLNFGTGNWTFSCWAYPTTHAADGFFRRLWMLDGATGNNTDNPQMTIDTADGGPYGWTNGNLEINGSISLTNAWHNVMLIRDGSTITQYVDTVADGTDTSFSIDTSNLNSGSPRVRIGSYDGGQGDFEGNFANMKIYNKALSTAELSDNFETERTRFGV